MNRTFHNTCALTCGLFLLLSGCAGNNMAGNNTSEPQRQHTQPATSAISDAAPLTPLDQLGNALAGYGDAYRIGDSIIVPLPDISLFRASDSVAISDGGEILLDRLGETLRAHPDNRIFIQEYIPAGNTEIQSRKQAMDQAFVIRSELIDRGLEPQRLIVDIEPRTTRGAPETQKVSLQHRFDLHIVPLE